MFDLKIEIDPRKWLGGIRSWCRIAVRRRDILFHARLVDVLVRFRAGDYVKHVTSINPDRRKVVESELSRMLSDTEYLDWSASQLATTIEDEIQLRMPEPSLWYELTCLAHAVRFPKDAYLVMCTVPPTGSSSINSSTLVAHLAQSFPFLEQAIEPIAPVTMGETVTECRLSVQLHNLLCERVKTLSIPRTIYALRYTSPPLFTTLQENDAGVIVLPTGWQPVPKGTAK
jgi:hypothetical protein